MRTAPKENAVERYKRDRDYSDADDIRADHVEVMNQRVGDNAAEQAFRRNHAFPADGVWE